MYTIGQAAKATGKSKSTISTSIKKGTISAVKNEDGSYSIDPSELHRVFPPAQSENGSTEPQSNDNEPSNLAFQNGYLQGEVKLLREQLADKDGVIDDLRQRLDAEAEARRIEGEERRKLTAILTDQRQPQQPKPAAAPLKPEPKPAPPKGLRGFLYRLAGAG
jgi:hypothetical protein